jgi:hypothetical protein
MQCRKAITFNIGEIMSTAFSSAQAQGRILQGRTVNRGANPFAAIVKQQNASVVPQANTTVYESAQTRGDRVLQHPKIQQSIVDLKKRLQGQTYQQKHFGELLLVRWGDVDINIDIQRDEDCIHIAEDIIDRFDPRLTMPVMCTRLANGRYSAWEGQQTTLTFYVLQKSGIIDKDTLIQIKAFDESLLVPGTTLQGEAVANMGFRVINGGGRKAIDAYHLHRSRVTGVRLYDSQFQEDIQSEEIQQIVERNNMFPAKTKDAAHNQATPGMITYIHGLNLIAGHDTDPKHFAVTKHDLDWALKWHDKYYPSEKGVDGGFILAFGRLSAQARENKIKLDANVEQDLYRLFRAKYGSPKGFHKDCKDRLEKFQAANNLAKSWTDSCLTPILVMDYINWGGKCALPQVNHMTTYAGI